MKSADHIQQRIEATLNVAESISQVQPPADFAERTMYRLQRRVSSRSTQSPRAALLQLLIPRIAVASLLILSLCNLVMSWQLSDTRQTATVAQSMTNRSSVATASVSVSDLVSDYQLILPESSISTEVSHEH